MAAAGLGAWEWNQNNGEATWSPETRELLGVAEGVPLTKDSFYSLIHPEDVPVCRQAEEESLSTGAYSCEFRVTLPDGHVRWIQSRGQVLRDQQGRNTRMIGVVADVTARRRSDERQKLLIDELNHRVKNTLAIIQSIASQTLRMTPDPAAFTTSFSARLQGLARIHGVLTQAMWESATVSDIVNAAMAPFGNDRINARGPRVALRSNSAVTLSKVLHELATNAVKYGALSAPGGRGLGSAGRLRPSLDRAGRALPPAAHAKGIGNAIDRGECLSNERVGRYRLRSRGPLCEN